MIYAAEIVDNTVTRIICCESATWCADHVGGSWVEVSMSPTAPNFAGVGDSYDAEAGTFSRPDPAGEP